LAARFIQQGELFDTGLPAAIRSKSPPLLVQRTCSGSFTETVHKECLEKNHETVRAIRCDCSIVVLVAQNVNFFVCFVYLVNIGDVFELLSSLQTKDFIKSLPVITGTRAMQQTLVYYATIRPMGLLGMIGCTDMNYTLSMFVVDACELLPTQIKEHNPEYLTACVLIFPYV